MHENACNVAHELLRGVRLLVFSCAPWKPGLVVVHAIYGDRNAFFRRFTTHKNIEYEV